MTPRTNDLGQPVGRELPGWLSRQHPQGVLLEGEWCRLEPLSPEHADALYDAWFSMTDRDWHSYVKHALEAWLSRENFSDGEQLTSLATHMRR